MRIYSNIILLFLVLFSSTTGTIAAQETNEEYAKSLELSEKTGVPVIIMHLPEWKTVQDNATLALDKKTLIARVGDRAVLNSFDYPGDGEAAIADYPEGKLVLIEFSSPQTSIAADNRIKQYLASNPNENITYRRIGNYNAFVFDAEDPAAAVALLDQIKYQKLVRWLNGDPYAQERAERGFVTQTKDLFIATAIAIVSGLMIAILFGISVGYIFYRFRQRERSRISTFTDGGGLTRLNLDSFTPEMEYRGPFRRWGFKEDSQ